MLERLCVEDEIRSAVLTREGPLGQLLDLVIHIERGAFDDVEAALPLLGLRVEELLRLQCDAYRWASAVESASEGVE